MNRGDVYERMSVRLFAIKEYATFKGDGVLADKIRKLELDVHKLRNADDTDENKEV